MGVTRPIFVPVQTVLDPASDHLFVSCPARSRVLMGPAEFHPRICIIKSRGRGRRGKETLGFTFTETVQAY